MGIERKDDRLVEANPASLSAPVNVWVKFHIEILTHASHISELIRSYTFLVSALGSLVLSDLFCGI